MAVKVKKVARHYSLIDADGREISASFDAKRLRKIAKLMDGGMSYADAVAEYKRLEDASYLDAFASGAIR